MPGYLIPSDLDRMIPAGADPREWAPGQLLASPGAIAIQNKKLFRIRTLVPAVKEDGSCIHFQKRECMIHAVSPFGCAFFDCRPDPVRNRLGNLGLIEVMKAWHAPSLYQEIWAFLWEKGHRQVAPEELHVRIARG